MARKLLLIDLILLITLTFSSGMVLGDGGGGYCGGVSGFSFMNIIILLILVIVIAMFFYLIFKMELRKNS